MSLLQIEIDALQMSLLQIEIEALQMSLLKIEIDAQIGFGRDSNWDLCDWLPRLDQPGWLTTMEGLILFLWIKTKHLKTIFN